MSFFAPSAAWLFLLALPLAALYFLKLKRPRVTVPSLVLWRRVLDDQRVNSPFQRFKRNLLLLLQLLLLLLLVLAAMQPFFRGSDERVTRLPLLIDCSASMAAMEKRGGTTRLAAAKQRAEEMIAGLLPDQEMAIISFSDSARQRTGFTGNKQLLKEALAEIEIEEVPSQIEHVFRMAQALGRGTAFNEVVLLSDGNVPTRADLDLSFQVNFQQLESPGSNLGITACAARRNRDDGWDILIEVGASAEADYGAALTMSASSAAAAEPMASELVTTKPGHPSRLQFSVPGDEEQELTFQLIPNAPFDALESDNVAYLKLPALRTLQVHVAESLASFRQALASMEKIDVYPNDRNVLPDAYDLVIGDDGEAEARAARVHLLLGMVPTALQGLVTMNQAPHQAIDWRRDAPLFQHVDFSNVMFLDDPVVTDFQSGAFLNLGYEVLLDGSHGPLLVQARQDERLSIYAFFHPDRSTFPFRVGFPVFVANLVQMTRQAAGLSESQALSTGLLPAVSAPPGQSVTIAGPSGDSTVLDSGPEGLLPGLYARRVGFYHYDAINLRQGASLLSLAETSMKNVDVVEFREARVRAESQEIETDRPLWQWFAGLALFVLLLEWWFYQRRPGGRIKATASH